jgi:uncharacterized membrane protein
MSITDEKPLTTSGTRIAEPRIRTISPHDLNEALVRGLDDFKAKPSHLVLLAIIYPVVAFLAFRVAAGYDLLPLVFPLLSGFALVGPLAAIGLYEMSRRREAGLDISWEHAFNVFKSHSIAAILALSAVLGALYFAWLGAALGIYWLTFGGATPTSVWAFARAVLTTPPGWALIVIGCGVGFFFALAVLAISAVSFPMLLDRDVSAMTAMRTSVRAFLANPVTMSMWGIIVAGLLVIGTVPLFVGLAVVMPVLGHATWHLYRRVVEY